MATAKTTDEYWSKLYDNGRDFTLVASAVLTKILSYVPDSTVKACLDIGCGTGQLTRELYHRGYQCVGVDASASAIKLAQSLTVLPQEHISYLQFDIEHDDIGALGLQEYQLITCKLVYAFIANKSAFLNQIKKLLAPNGIFVVITPQSDDVPLERRTIAVDHKEINLLSKTFEEVALYKDNSLQGALTYFIGQLK